MGFTCGSDDHKGRPGAAQSGSGAFGIYGGITCVYAKELTRESIWEAIKTRRCYGTSGQRILIDVTVGGQPMGSDLSTNKPPEIAVKVWGTAPIEKVDIFRGTEIIYTHPQTIPPATNRHTHCVVGATHQGAQPTRALGWRDKDRQRANRRC